MSRSQANIIGEDTRVEKFFTEPAHRKIVYLNGCTGSLIGPDLVLTASHCIEDIVIRNSNGSWTVKGGHYIYAEKRGHNYSARSEILTAVGGHSVDFGRSNQATDWAILRIATPLGNTFGYFDILPKLEFKSAENYELWTAGFSGDRVIEWGDPYLTGPREKGWIRYNSGTLVHHNLPANKGASGSPIWKTIHGIDTIVALHVAYKYKATEAKPKFGFIHKDTNDWFDWANVAINPSVFYGEFLKLRQSCQYHL